MTWTWQFQKADGTLAGSRSLPKETFGSQGDAETWLGEQWRSRPDSGVDQVSLVEDGRCESGPMSLHPAADPQPSPPAPRPGARAPRLGPGRHPPPPAAAHTPH